MEDNKYIRGKLYKIVCNITGETYYGSTIKTLNDRLTLHKNDKGCLSRNIISRGDYEIIPIKDYPCNSKYELEEEEAKYIRNNNCINRNIPHRTQKEYIEDNKEEIKKKRDIKKEEKKTYDNNYYKNKKKTKLKQNSEYRKNNRELINKKQNEKITCECGSVVSRVNLKRHKKSLNHIELC